MLKDIILVGAAMVIAAATFRGGRLHGISEAQFHDWRETARTGAAEALDERAAVPAA